MKVVKCNNPVGTNIMRCHAVTQISRDRCVVITPCLAVQLSMSD